jgi:hypothetical protein
MKFFFIQFLCHRRPRRSGLIIPPPKKSQKMKIRGGHDKAKYSQGSEIKYLQTHAGQTSEGNSGHFKKVRRTQVHL